MAATIDQKQDLPIAVFSLFYKNRLETAVFVFNYFRDNVIESLNERYFTSKASTMDFFVVRVNNIVFSL